MDSIADLRLAPDRYLSIEEDRAKGRRVIERAQGRGYRAALEAYWEMTPELAPRLAGGHLRRQAGEAAIGSEALGEIERVCGPSEGAFLDLGCGAGGVVAAAARRCKLVVGVDAAFRWLLIARELLREQGSDAVLIAANAEALPFAAGSFERIAASDLIEHVADPTPVLAECARALAPSGKLYVATNNRFSLLGEPHVRLWGVGFLPRGLQRAYVKFRRGHDYDRVRLLSAGDMRRRLRAAGFKALTIEAAPVFAAHLGGVVRAAVRAAEALRRRRSIARLVGAVAPRVQAVCSRGGRGGRFLLR